MVDMLFNLSGDFDKSLICWFQEQLKLIILKENCPYLETFFHNNYLYTAEIRINRQYI